MGGAASRFLHLRWHGADLDPPLCTYYYHLGGAGTSISGSSIVARLWAGKLGHRRLGFHPNKIGSHSLRSGGAMTLHQAGVDDSTIKIIGRWKSDTFLIYLQGQVLTFTRGVAAKMRQVMWFASTSPTPP